MNGVEEPEVTGWVRKLLEPTAAKRILFYLVTDAAVVLGASVLTHLAVIHHVGSGLAYYVQGVVPFAAVALICQLSLASLASSYRLQWSTFSLIDVPRIVFPSGATALLLGGLVVMRAFAGLNAWSVLTWGLLSACGVVAVRGSRRFYLEVLRRKSGKRAILVMCSHKAYFLLDTLHRIQHFNYHIIGFVCAALAVLFIALGNSKKPIEISETSRDPTTEAHLQK